MNVPTPVEVRRSTARLAIAPLTHADAAGEAIVFAGCRPDNHPSWSLLACAPGA